MISQILFVGGTSLCATAASKSGPGRHDNLAQLLQHASRHVEQSGGIECGQVSCGLLFGTLQTKLDFHAKVSQLTCLPVVEPLDGAFNVLIN